MWILSNILKYVIKNYWIKIKKSLSLLIILLYIVVLELKKNESMHFNYFYAHKNWRLFFKINISKSVNYQGILIDTNIIINIKFPLKLSKYSEKLKNNN